MKKRSNNKGAAKKKLNAEGIDGICAKIGDCITLTKIAKDIGVSIGSLISWINANPERSARAREAREATAKCWDERAEHGIKSAKNPFGLAKARELAHHYRWRASKIAPKEYGEKIDLNHGGKIEFTGIKLEVVDAPKKG